jgi:cytochrome b
MTDPTVLPLLNTAGRQSAAHPLVWDLPVRLVHALLALSFAGAWLTAESEALHLIHITLGYTVGGLVAFRLVWGLIGSRTARFSSFVKSPQAAWRYLGALTSGQPEHHTGHNPAGAWAIVALLGLGLATAVLGWATETERLPDAWEELHEAAATLMLAVVGLHLLGVLVGTWCHHENLPRAMLTGRKAAPASEGISRSHAGMAWLVLVAVLAFWSWQASQAPAGALQASWTALRAGTEGGHDGDND